MNHLKNQQVYPHFQFDERNRHYLPGMTLRQHYAGLAMQAIRSHYGHGPAYTAEMAVEYADALLAELVKPTKN